MTFAMSKPYQQICNSAVKYDFSGLPNKPSFYAAFLLLSGQKFIAAATTNKTSVPFVFFGNSPLFLSL
jgi:hypothetical protein